MLRLRAARYGIWNRRASCEPRTRGRTSPGAGSLLGTGYTSTWDPQRSGPVKGRSDAARLARPRRVVNRPRWAQMIPSRDPLACGSGRPRLAGATDRLLGSRRLSTTTASGASSTTDESCPAATHPRLYPSSVSGPGIGPPPDPFWTCGRPDARHEPGPRKAQRLDQEQSQGNHIAEQDAVLPSVRAEHALMNLRGSLFCALAAAPKRPSAATEDCVYTRRGPRAAQ